MPEKWNAEKIKGFREKLDKEAEKIYEYYKKHGVPNKIFDMTDELIEDADTYIDTTDGENTDDFIDMNNGIEDDDEDYGGMV